MADKFHSNIDSQSSEVEKDLLAALLEPDDAPYPWNVAAPESEAYFVAQEEGALLALSEAQIAVPRQAFFSALDLLWADVSHQEPRTNLEQLQNSLQQRFAVGIPQSWLNEIAIQAEMVFSTPTSVAQRLVQCIQELVPNWAEEDLLVLARPFAYAMRSSDEALDTSKLQGREWQDLTAIEQIKISLAVARSALNQLQSASEDQI